MRECGLDVKESLEGRIVVHALQFQIPFLEHLEYEGVVTLGLEHIDLHDDKKEVDDVKEESHGSKEKASVAGASALGEWSSDQGGDHQGDAREDSKVSKGETSWQMKKEAQTHDSSQQIKRRVPVSVSGIKLKYVMKTDVGKLEGRYKVTIKPYPSTKNPEGFEIVGSTVSDLQNAEKRIKEAIKFVDETEIKSIASKGKMRMKQKGELLELLQKMEEDDAMVFDIPEDGNEVLLMGEVENCITKLEEQFGNVLELSEDEPLDEDSTKLNPDFERSATDAMDRTSKPDSAVGIFCESEVFEFMREKNPGFLAELEEKYVVEICEDGIDGFVEITVSGEYRKAAEVTVREAIEKHEKMMAEEGKLPGTSRKASQGCDDKPPVPSKKLKPSLSSSSSSSSDHTPPLDSKSPKLTSASGLPLKTFRSKASRSRVHVFAYDITKLKVDIIVNAANDGLMHGAGVAWAIQKAAGRKLEEESKAYVRNHGRVKVTDLAVTSGGNMPCTSVFHAVGPNMADYYGNKGRCFGDLAQTVINCLEKAASSGYESIAIPAISSGKQM